MKAFQEGQIVTESPQNTENAIVEPTEMSSKVEELTREMEAQAKKIEKLKKYIANVEADGDRLGRELVIANSYKICFDSITNPLFMVDTSYHIHYANNAFLDITNSSPEILQARPACSEFLNCTHFRNRCLLKECFAEKRGIKGFKCSFFNTAERQFTFVVDALPIHNIATNEILGGFEIFREIVEDTLMKCLMFMLSDQEFGVSIKKLKCIIPMQKITPVPKLPDYVRGVIDLRGQVIPIFDLNCRLGFDQIELSDRQRIIIMESKVGDETKAFGFIVDQVIDIRTINAKDIEPAQSVDYMGSLNYIAGIAKVDKSARVIIDTAYLDHLNAQDVLVIPT